MLRVPESFVQSRDEFYSGTRIFTWIKTQLVLLVMLTASSASSQWQLVHDFSGTGISIQTTYFLHEQGAPHVGFVGLTDTWQQKGLLMRTSDAGKSWIEVGKFEQLINEIYFKDADTGWLVTTGREIGQGGCYSTFNGGQSWQLMLGSEGGRFALEYLASTDLLIISGWQSASLYTTDRGANWSAFTGCRNGYAFLSVSDGIVSNVGGTCEGEPYYVTSDGGLTWKPSAGRMAKECWQPIAIPEHNLYLIISEPEEGDVYGSTDLGQSWQKRGNLGERFRLSGQLVYDGCLLYTQSFTLGISVSDDLGYTWQHVGGPAADADTRLFLYKDTIYAGDLRARLWVNHNKAYPANRLAVRTRSIKENETSVTLSLPLPWPSHGDGVVGIDTATFELEYNKDELELISEAPSLNHSIKRKTDLALDRTEYVVHRKQRFIEHDTDIIEFKFRSNVNPSGIGGYVRVSNVRFDSLSPGVACMRLDPPVDSVYIGIPQCGDSVLSNYLANGTKAIAIKSINPNPTNGSITIDYESKLSGAVTLSVYSVNGVLVHEEVLATAPSHKPIQLNTSGWASGAYNIVLKSGDEEASASLIKN